MIILRTNRWKLNYSELSHLSYRIEQNRYNNICEMCVRVLNVTACTFIGTCMHMTRSYDNAGETRPTLLRAVTFSPRCCVRNVS